MVALEKKALTLNVKVIGSGETTVVLAHGFGADQSVWDYILPEVVNTCRVLVFDWNFADAVDRHESHELSKHPVYDDFSDALIFLLDSLTFRDVLFVGHSMSAMVGVLAAVKRPSLFRRLLLLCASPRYLNSMGYEGGFENHSVEEVFANIESNFEPWARAFASMTVGQNYPAEATKFGELLIKMGAKVALPLARTVFLSDFTETLEQVNILCTIVNGPRDFVIPPSVADFIRRKVNASASIEQLDFDGHFPQLTVPRSLIELIRRLT